MAPSQTLLAPSPVVGDMPPRDGVRDGVSKWVESMRQAADNAEISAERWAEQYEQARPKMIENFRLDPNAYRSGLENAGAPAVGPMTTEAYRMSEQAARDALAKAVVDPPQMSPAEAAQLRAVNQPKVDCFCNILAKTDEEKALCNQVLEDYIFGRIELDDIDAILANRFGARQVKQANKTAKKHCPV